MIKKYLIEIILTSILIIITVSLALYLKTPNDDAYIYLVYVNNFLQGNGLSFNGTIVEGYTSPLWVILLSFFGFSGIDLAYIGQGLSLVFTLGAVILIYFYAIKTGLNKWIAFIPALLLAASGDTGVYALSGLETGCFVFFVLLSFYIAANLKAPFSSRALPLALSITSWVRPEGMLITAIFFLALLIKTGESRDIRKLPYKDILRFCSIYALTLLPLFIFRYIYYDGEFLSNTYYAKASAGLNNLPYGIEYFKKNLSNFSYLIFYVPPIIVFYFIKHWRAFLAEFLFLLCWTGYVVIIGGDNMVGGRALLPVFPVMFLLTVSGIKHLLSRFNILQKLGRSSIALSLISGIAAASFFLYNYSNNENISQHITDMKNNSRLWSHIGNNLKKNVPPDTLIAVGAAGMIPYFSELPTIDIFGLN
ncbi:MAG: hypothetical protein KAJ10_05185, partial [Thermodesulfovibrionia bacterium]|nr:hypothetical protein [Thermodesulfovibrionia bacterium]